MFLVWLACLCGEKAFYKEMTSHFDDTFVTEKKKKKQHHYLGNWLVGKLASEDNLNIVFWAKFLFLPISPLCDKEVLPKFQKCSLLV